MDRRRLLRSLAWAGLGATAAACGLRDGGGPGDAPPPEQPTGSPPARHDDAAPPPEPSVEDDEPDAAEPTERGEPEEGDPADAEEPDPAQEEAPAGRVEVLCREALGLRPAEPTGARHRLDRLTLHHTAVALEAAALAPERLRRHQRHHRDAGWPDIAYHYAVDLAGNVYELRDPAVPGDTFTDYDTTGHLQIVCEGDYDRQRPSDALLEGVGDLLAALAAAHDLPLDSLEPHRTYVATTACPGRHLRARVADLRAHAAGLVRQGAPAIDLRCDDGAHRRVAAIEAG